MAKFHLHYPVADLRGADYNPRRIDEQSLQALRDSLAILGVAKPIIVSGKLIVAGHQRTKSLRALGWEAVPAIVLDNVTVADEIRFNQLHNGTDFDSHDEDARIAGPSGPLMQFEEVEASRLTANPKAKKINIRYEIADLLLLYGNWGCCVATESGEVIHAAQYAMACQMLNMPIRVYRVADAIADQARELLGRQYGVFSYDHLARKTYIQTFAQPFRGRGAKSGSGCAWQNDVRSKLYEELVLPNIKPTDRVLDFGCGQGDMLRMLQAKGYRILGVEFFYRAGGQIDARAVHRMIDQLALHISRHGLFDAVLADSVINSVDSLEAESDVMTCLNAFTKPGGQIFFSGRSREYLEERESNTRLYHKKKMRDVEFLDEHGFSGTFREGEWFYQLFHAEAQARELATRYVNPEHFYTRYEKCMGTNSWGVAGVKSVELPREQVRAALAREFNLLWPAGRRVGKADVILAAWERASQNTSRQTANFDNP